MIKKDLIKINYAVLLSFFLMYGCEDVITYELNSTTPRIVIEGAVTDEAGPYKVKISRSSDYFNFDSYNNVSNAEVIISDSRGNSETLSETSPGVYETADLVTHYNTEYYLKVKVGDDLFEASTILLEPIIIDSLSYEIDEDDEEYVVTSHFQDDPDKEDYAVTNFKLGDRYEKPMAYSDRLTNGNYIETQRHDFHKDSLKTGINRIECRMRTVDANTYEYFKTLIEALAVGTDYFSSTTPENPKSNLSNGALGYFGAYAISRNSIDVKK